jgi:hypothetical protein
VAVSEEGSIVEIKGRKTGSGITLEGLLTAVSDLRHRMRHGLIMLAAYGPGYGTPDPERVKIAMAPWTEDPATPLSSAKPTTGDQPAPRRHNTHVG